MGKMYKQKCNYTQVANVLIQDNGLSYKAKGIYSYLVSRPDEWDFYVADIVKQSKDGKEAVQSGLKELEQSGYLVRKMSHDKCTGKFIGYDYYLHDQPQNTVDGESRPTVNPVEGESPSHNNTDLINKTEVSNSPCESPKGETPSQQHFHADIVESVVAMWTNAGGNKPHTIDDALVRRVVSVHKNYDFDSIKIAISKLFTALNDKDNYYSQPISLFEFLSANKFSKWLHADLSGMRKFETKQRTGVVVKQPDYKMKTWEEILREEENAKEQL